MNFIYLCLPADENQGTAQFEIYGLPGARDDTGGCGAFTES